MPYHEEIYFYSYSFELHLIQMNMIQRSPEIRDQALKICHSLKSVFPGFASPLPVP